MSLIKTRNPNPFPIGIKFGFLKYGGPKGIRTLDLSDANRTLSQLSYGPMCLTREIRALNCVWDVARVTTA